MGKLFDPLVRLAGLGANVHIVAMPQVKRKFDSPLPAFAGKTMPKRRKQLRQDLSA